MITSEGFREIAWLPKLKCDGHVKSPFRPLQKWFGLVADVSWLSADTSERGAAVFLGAHACLFPLSKCASAPTRVA